MRCYELEGVRRFNDRAELYARARPGYPDEAIAFVAEKITGVVVDVGAGTGISSRLLARRFPQVVALDPNVAMLATGHPDNALKLVAGSAESLPVADRSAALLTAFNAFHWFRPEYFFLEVRRVLKPSGRLAVVWNDWNLEDSFTREFVALMRSAAGDYPPEDREAEVAPLFAAALGPVRTGEFANEHVLDAQTLPMRLQSMTYIPKEGAAWEELNSRLRTLYDQYRAPGGTVTHHYVTRAYVVDVERATPNIVEDLDHAS